MGFFEKLNAFCENATAALEKQNERIQKQNERIQIQESKISQELITLDEIELNNIINGDDKQRRKVAIDIVKQRCKNMDNDELSCNCDYAPKYQLNLCRSILKNRYSSLSYYELKTRYSCCNALSYEKKLLETLMSEKTKQY